MINKWLERRSLSFKILLTAGLILLAVEILLMFISVESMRNRAIFYREYIAGRIPTIENPTPENLLPDDEINHLVWNYGKNIFLMVGLILLIQLTGIYVIFKWHVLDPLEDLLKANEETQPGTPAYIDESNISNDKLGTVMRNRNEMLRRLNEATVSKRYLSALEQGLQPQFITDTNGNLEYVNRGFVETTGYEKEEASSLNLQELRDPETDQLDFEEIRSELLDGQTFEKTTANRKKDGSVFYADEAIAPVYDQDHQVKNFVVNMQDITERKQLEEDLRETIEMKNTLLKEVHHRVKNNMQVISSLFGLERRRSNHESCKNSFQEMQRRIQSMGSLHEHLYRQDEMAEIDIAAYLETVLNEAVDSYRISDQKISKEIAIGVDMIDLDTAIPLGLILNELTINAMQHGIQDESSGYVKLKMNRNGSEYYLEFINSGSQIDPEIFEKSNNSLGLNLVKGLMENQLNGQLKTEAIDNETILRMSFPVDRDLSLRD